MERIRRDKIVFSKKEFPLECSLSKTGSQSVSLWHETVEFKYVISGSVTMMIDTQTVTAQAGQIIFINPYEVHSNIRVEGEEGTYHLYMLDPDFFTTVGAEWLDLRSLLLDKRIRFQNRIHSPRVARILQEIAGEYAQGGEYARIAITGLLTELFSVLLRSYICQTLPSEAISDRVRFYKAVEPAVLCLRDRYAEQFSGDVLADSCGLSRHHFCRVFKRAMGMTPVQYQNECRLRMADILMASGTMTVSQIAHQVGFGDEAYFSRAYKRSRGICPTEARAKLSK